MPVVGGGGGGGNKTALEVAGGARTALEVGGGGGGSGAKGSGGSAAASFWVAGCEAVPWLSGCCWDASAGYQSDAQVRMGRKVCLCDDGSIYE